MTTISSKARSVAFGLATALIGPAFAGDPTGTWLTEGGKSQVRLANCGEALCGRIQWLKEPSDPATGKPKRDVRNPDPGKRDRPIVGVDILMGMRPDQTPNQWAGDIYNPEDGKTYRAHLTLQDARTLQVKGCVLGGLICKSQAWSRAN
jgi:uncharacterized protein (DUF2147 family)